MSGKWDVGTRGGESWSSEGLKNVTRRRRENTGPAANSVVREEAGAAGAGEEAGKGAMNRDGVLDVGREESAGNCGKVDEIGKEEVLEVRFRG